ncbi:proton-conducting transporter membrane subunit [Kaistia geumhonensis]|uniref:Probable inorganic carbon transporter subunit DabB n=1 Tax=Kaistia geumhonensis TaxID=410839 RepID=A0ABU0M428_9HYPH|nr:proton-conducting transporter membrane subunit [Kaistia geumhonensis]MCX5479068.1 proton-conducting transporter membrane subunit [Kaistia geumhonensis]MDQ0515712.1 NAD(P)H-quinone oxidoreductase subunit 5 [Kaistia geumhonensis]
MPAFQAFIPYLAPLVMLAAAVHAGRHPDDPRRVQRFAEASGVAALVVALATLLELLLGGRQTSPLIGVAGLGLSARIDALSVSMLLLVAVVGLVVLRFSRNYLAGDPGQPRFAGGLALTLAAVMALVIAGNLVQLLLAFVATSLALHRLLLFYPNRPKAVIAARKKFLVARLADLALAASLAVIWLRFGTADIAAIAEAAKAAPPGATDTALVAAAILLALAAMLKSAQFPSHGWLPEIVETPTPVSALLHAGIINAGGFLVLRLADVMLLAPPALHLLALVGGFTALFASAVMLTQPAVKIQLAWSTIAQMGFMLFQCGIGAFSIALLHILAHSLYKAHAFLSSGTAVAAIRATARTQAGGRDARSPAWRVALVGAAVALVAAVAWLLLPIAADPASLTLAGIFGLGLALLALPAAEGRDGVGSLVAALGTALAASLAYALLHAGANHLFAAELPVASLQGAVAEAILILAFASFALLALLQLTAHRWIATPAGRAARIHLANGLYLDAFADRFMAKAQPNLPS